MEILRPTHQGNHESFFNKLRTAHIQKPSKLPFE